MKLPAVLHCSSYWAKKFGARPVAPFMTVGPWPNVILIRDGAVFWAWPIDPIVRSERRQYSSQGKPDANA
jgi:hypothetical protein